jgi:hypothetical protein
MGNFVFRLGFKRFALVHPKRRKRHNRWGDWAYIIVQSLPHSQWIWNICWNALEEIAQSGFHVLLSGTVKLIAQNIRKLYRQEVKCVWET